MFLISQYGESVSIIILSTGMHFTTSRFSGVFREQPFIPIIMESLNISKKKGKDKIRRHSKYDISKREYNKIRKP